MRLQGRYISSLLVAFAVVTGVGATSATTEEVKGRGPAPAEKRAGIPGAIPGKEALQCPAQESSFGGKDSARFATTKRDSSCYVDWLRAADLARAPSSVVIDIRSPEAYARLHLPGAINIAAEQIKTKSFLSGKTILIYGDGKSDPRLEELCADLKGKGFGNARILSGGILAWARTPEAGAAEPAGQEIDIRKLAELSAAELYAELQAADSQIVRVSQRFSDPEIDARALRLDGELTPENLGSLLQKAKRQQTPLRRVILVGVNTTRPKVLLEALSSARIGGPVFYYPDDAERYESSVRNLRALWAKKNKGPVASRCGFS